LSARAGLALLGIALAAPVLACGHCVEDKIAAAYDHAVVVQALERKHAVAYFALEGTMPPGAATRRKLRALAESLAGVERGTVRVSSESASLSFAFDPVRHPHGPLAQALDRKLAASGLRAFPLRVVDRPPGASAASSRSGSLPPPR